MAGLDVRSSAASTPWPRRRLDAGWRRWSAAVAVLTAAGAAPALATPDLVPTDLTAPASATTQEPLTASWTVENQGSTTASGGWRDHLWLSTDAALGGDTDLGFVDEASLAPGASYTATLNATVPTVPAGDYFLLVQVDFFDTIAEVSEANDTFAIPFHVNEPDLVPTGITAPPSAATQQPFTASWTVENQGSGQTTPGWRDHLWLSTDAVLGGDTNLGFVDHAGLAAGASYTSTLDTTVPNVTPGDYYLIVQTDFFDSVFEVSEGNDTFAIPFTVTQPDLVPIAIAAPASAAAGQGLTASWSVENQGNGQTTPGWRDHLWLSADAVLGGDTDLGFVDHSGLAAGASYTASLSASVPNVSAGTYYLIVQTDFFDAVQESNEGNNTFVQAIQVTVCGDGSADAGEACDLGPANGTPTACCTATCEIRAAGQSCRPAVDVCDAAESCDGVSSTCPADARKPSGTQCRAAADVCDLAASCDGSGAACPPNPFRPSTTLCRSAVDACDADDYCTGSSAGCVDGKQPSGHVCRSAAGACDAVEACNGLSNACPPDGFLASTVVCRPSTDPCDVAETCSGTGPACPPDTGLPDTDGDTIGDACDPCTNGAIATKQKLTALKLRAPAGDEKLSIKGEAVLPASPVIDPVTRGVRLVLTSNGGATLLDVTVPGGGYDATLKSGWKANGTSTAWTFKALGLATQGITQVAIKLNPSVRDGIKFAVKGRNGAYPIAAGDVPVTATLVVDAPIARTGQCAVVQFPGAPPASPGCALVALGSTLKCK